MNYLKKYGTYATHSEIYGYKCPKTEIISLIKNAKMGGLIRVLSELCTWSKYQDDIDLRKDFFNFCEAQKNKPIANARIKFFKFKLYTFQGLLTVWKWLLAFGNEDTLQEEYENPNESTMRLLLLCICVSDYLYDSITDTKKMCCELIRNISFNTWYDHPDFFGRTYYIYLQLSKKQSMFYDKDFVDINKNFKLHFGYTVIDFISIWWGLIARYYQSPDNQTIRLDLNVNGNQLFENTKLKKLGTEIISQYSGSFKEMKQWCLNHLDEAWNYKLFYQKPILQLNNECIYPISIFLFYEQLYNSLVYKLAEPYSNKKARSKFLSFKGQPFEKYVSILLENSIDQIQGRRKYTFIPEFSYHSNGKKSFDCGLQFKDKLIAVEAKSNVMRLDSLITNSVDSLFEDLEKMAIAPVIQILERLNEIKDFSQPINFKKINEIYIIIVNPSNFPVLQKTEEMVEDKIKPFIFDKIKSITRMNIEEYELFCSLVHYRNTKKKRDIFHILDKMKKNDPYMPFKHFIQAYKYKCKPLKFIISNIEKAFELFSDNLF